MSVPIAIEGVLFDYPDGTRALDGIDVVIPAGERLAIVGQNGSGKSTLVRQLNGLLRPTSGRIVHDGQDVASRHVAELARTVGLVFQNPDRQIFGPRVRAEVEFGPRNIGLRGEALDVAVRAALEAVGFVEDGDLNPYDLGFSRRKLLAIASVLAMGTPVVVLDEPTTGQDAAGMARVKRIVGTLSAAGRTVISITHDMRFAAETFERILVMRAGRVILDGAPAEVFAESNWRALASTWLEPPFPARVSARLGLPATPTDRALVEAVRARGETWSLPVDDRS
ncbi:MAG TPA: ABC transporter ATP-binding protein [Candidatus Limnocylindrales bacterium]|jgi:energy-coupling factor transport system ATP-binding protein|nr:ABC transporter ATP-binding protein [Candidatus Limnocylindrales bacterium]